MIPPEQALTCVDRVLDKRRLETETLPTREAVGRYLTTDQRSRVDLPPFDRAAMDGYAISTDEIRDEYRLLGVVAAGMSGVSELPPDTTVKVMTGAPVPPGTTRVVVVEQATEHDGRVRFENPSSASNIRRRAEDLVVGQTILPAGTCLTPLDVANLISCGIVEVEVARAARLAIIATGDEIVESPADLGPGKIMNTNGPMLAGLARRHGLSVVSEVTVGDDKEKLTAALRRGLSEADIVVLSGGVSVGDFDFGPDAIAECNLETHFARLALKPGKPTLFAADDRRVVFGLPGNPVAVYLAFHLFVLRAVALLSGGHYAPREIRLPLAGDFSRRSTSRREFVPARITPDGRVEALPCHSSAHLAALTGSEGFLVVPQGVGALRAGEEATFAVIEIGGR